MKQETIKITEKELTLVESNLLNSSQLQLLFKKTPEKYVKTRPAKGGGTWSYVSANYIQKCLNLMFGWNWDFEILDEKILIDAKQVIVKGKLVCRIEDKTITKIQYGRKDIAFQKSTNTPLDLGNDLKAASSDALKKCASMLGIAGDVYGKEDFREVEIEKTDSIIANKDEERLIKFINDAKDLNAMGDIYEKIQDLDPKSEVIKIYNKKLKELEK